MDDIRRRDIQLFVRELVEPMRLLAVGASGVAVWAYAQSAQSLAALFLGAIVIPGGAALTAWNSSVQKRFLNKRTQTLWQGCQDRLARFEEVLKKMRRDQVADLHEMPNTIRGVAQSLYLALRRADMIAHEVHASERSMIAQPPVWRAGSTDPQSQELYRLADKNIAEYRAQYAGVMAGVERTEAQSAVFMTTVDTLRMKMIGYRLVGRSPELASQDFLEALAEARAQLQSIDTALEELDLSHYPKTIAAIPTTPPPIPDDIQQRLKQG